MNDQLIVDNSVRGRLISKAILMISTIESEESKLDTINSNLKELFGDFSPNLRLATEQMLQEIIDILDLILGEDLASYYLYECGGKGKITEKDGTEWPITCLEELRKYAEHIRKKYP